MRLVPRSWLRSCAGVVVGAGASFAPTPSMAQAPLAPAYPTTTPVVHSAPTTGCANGNCAPAATTCATCSGRGGKDCGACGLTQYPFFEKRYIKQFCKPTVSPSSCFGHFKPQITRWNDACPNWSTGSEIVHPGSTPPRSLPPSTTNSDGTPPPSDPLLPPLKEPGKTKPVAPPVPPSNPPAPPSGTPLPAPAPKPVGESPVPPPQTSLPLPVVPQPSTNLPIIVPAIPDLPPSTQPPTEIPQPISTPSGKF